MYRKIAMVAVIGFGVACGDSGSSTGGGGGAGGSGSGGATACEFQVDQDPSASSCEFPCDGFSTDLNKPGLCTLVCSDTSSECPSGTECAMPTFGTSIVCLPPCADGCPDGLVCDTDNWLDHCVPWN